MANTDWEFTKIGIILGQNGDAYMTGTIEQYVGGYSGPAGITSPTGSSGNQLRVFNLQAWRKTNTPYDAPLAKLRADLFLSSSAYPQLTQVVSSSAYSIRTWVRMDLANNVNTAAENSNNTTFAAGIVFKAEDSSENNNGVDDNNVDCGYRLMLTTDTLTGTNKTNRQLNLKLCGANWTTNAILCSSSLNGFDFSMGEWYRIRLDVFEKYDTENEKRDDVYAYLYNTGSAEWEQIGQVSYHKNSSSYIRWKNDEFFTGGERAGIVSYLFAPWVSFSNIGDNAPNETNSLILNTYYDLVEVYAIPWDRNAP